jgi:hypothetical protein
VTAAGITSRRTSRSTWGDRLGILIPAVLAYVPLLLTQPGQVGADTKTYLYLDPSPERDEMLLEAHDRVAERPFLALLRRAIS